jgi:ATP-dependent DNA helicase DinG
MTTALADFDLLRRAIPGYEERDGQLRMAAAIESALRSKQHAAIEAPCGIGKSFAYLVPAIRHAVETKSRVVVCTANIALQEQLIAKDLPALEKTLPVPFRYALIKGINNYLCLERFADARDDMAQLLLPTEEGEDWDELMEWAGLTDSGDPAELESVVDPVLWNRVNGVSELCNGARCRAYDACFAMHARRRLRDVQVIVTNYHYFFAHVGVKREAERDVLLPPHSAVICDEAHEMADIARDFLGRRLTPHSVNYLLAGARRFGLWKDADRVRSASRVFFEEVRAHRESPRYKIRLRDAGYAAGAPLADAVGAYREAVLGRLKESPDDETQDRLVKSAGACDRFRETLDDFQRLDDPNKVYYIDGDGRLVARLVDVSSILRESLFETTDSVVMTSATLATGSSFDFHRRETGVAKPRELVVASPFDFRRQALLVVPVMQNGPNDPGFAAEVSRHLNRIISFLGGRTLALFTSYRNMDSCAEAARSTGVSILKQKDKPRTRLLDEFRRDRGTALFATASFWQGVDVPGEALSCLTIDRIPFITPEDPLLDALQERDDGVFRNYQVPKATLALRQGFGRLIRTATDRGVVVIFDKRLFSMRYGREMLEALPDVAVHRDLDELERFFERKLDSRGGSDTIGPR